MNINDYFEMYLKNRVKYDRSMHVKNLNILDTPQITNELVKKIFTYIDAVLFNSSLTKYINENNISFKCKISKSLTSTAGMFYWKTRGSGNNVKIIEMGFKMSYSFFQNIIDNNTLNMDLGVIDSQNKPYLSTNTIEPLLVTMEHEIIHMLMYVTSSNALNDLNTVKSGHTPAFKKLVYNIFGHYRITHGFSVGDVKKSQEIKRDIQLGDYVEDTTKGVKGYVVGKKNRYLVVCSIIDVDINNNINNNENVYNAVMYNNLKKINTQNNNKIDIIEMIDRLKPKVNIQYAKMNLTVKKVNKTTILAESDRGKVWRIPIFRILDIVFLD